MTPLDLVAELTSWALVVAALALALAFWAGRRFERGEHEPDVGGEP